MVTADTKLRAFQEKILNNILLVNKMLFKLKKVESPCVLSAKLKIGAIGVIGAGKLPFY